jgi:hypothetical protein
LSYVLQAVSLCLRVSVLNGVLYSQGCGFAVTAAHAQSPKNTHTRTIERRIHLAPFGANGSRYVYVPFDVPRGAVRVSVSYDYARADGANTLDLGVFDSRADGPGVELGTRGFRGWSGGRRNGFFISRDEATPGYLPGRLPAGRWRVVLGLYRVAPAGVDVSFKIVVETGEDRASRAATANATGDAAERPPSPVRQTAGRGLRWWSGDLHMHTVHSDGDWTVPGLASAAREGGLDFIFVTDHNTSSHHAEIARVAKDSRRPLVLRGEEITTYGGHTNAWGLPAGGWVDFRVRPGDSARMSAVAASAHRYGALISINHPFALCGGCAWSYGEALKDFDAVEVWNGDWDATDESALRMWDEALRRGLRLTAVASSDSHRPQNPIGRPASHVAADALTQAALLAAVRRGRVYLTNEAARPVVVFEAERRGRGRTPRALPGDEIRLNGPGVVGFYVNVREAPPDATVSVISGGRVIRNVPVGDDGGPLVLEMLCRDDSYYRVEVRERSGAMLALTNPIYIRVRAGR